MDDVKDNAYSRTGYILHILFKHKVRVLIVFFTIVAGVTAWSFFAPRTYEAGARIVIAFLPRNIAPSSDAASQNNSNPDGANSAQDQRINYEVERLKSGTLIAKAIGDVGIENIYPSILKKHKNSPSESVMSRAVTLFQEDLTVKAARNSNVITIRFTHNSPIVASQAVNMLVSRFVEHHAPKEQTQPALAVSPETPTMQPIDNGHSTSSNTVSEASLRETGKALTERISEMEKNLAKTRDELSKQVEMIRMINAYQPGRDAPLEFDQKQVPQPPQIIDSLRTQLTLLKVKEQELLKKYMERNFLVVSVREEIRDTQKSLVREEKTYLNNLLPSTKTKAQTLEAKAETLRGNIAQGQEELAKVQNAAEKLRGIEDKRIMERENAKKAESRRLVSVGIAESALPPTKPVRPKPALNISLALILGVIFGLGAGILPEYLRPTFRNPGDVEQHLGLTVLASISQRTTAR